MNVLYISYDGALDPLGRSQVVPYLLGLSRLGHRFDLLTFEKPERWQEIDARRDLADALRTAGIAWHPRRYHKRWSLASTSFDLASAVRQASPLITGRGIQLIHARSYPSALVARRLGRAHGVPYLFDIRGLYPEERVDAGSWRATGALYRLAKAAERRLFRDAAHVVTLTEASVPVVTQRIREAGGSAAVDVIPTAVDLNRFPVQPNESNRFALAYVGSIGTWYLAEEMLAFGQLARQELGATVRFVVNDRHALQTAMDRHGVDGSHFEILSVPHDQVSEALRGVSATFAFIRPSPSKIASAATKVAESLACGLPIAVNSGVGDASRIVEEERVGVVADPFSPGTWSQTLVDLAALSGDPAIRARCRQVAERRFGLGIAVEDYDRIYRSVAPGVRSP